MFEFFRPFDLLVPVTRWLRESFLFLGLLAALWLAFHLWKTWEIRRDLKEGISLSSILMEYLKKKIS